MLGDKQKFYKNRSRGENPVLYQKNSALEYTLKKKIKSFLFMLFVFASWLLASHFHVRFILEFGALMWFFTAIVVFIMQNERKNIILRLQQTMLGYCWGALLYKIVVMRLANIPTEEWSRALGYQVPEAFTGNIAGWMGTMSVIVMAGVPIAYGAYLGQKFYAIRTNRKVADRRKEYMRTGEQKYH
ncbi:MAG: hypothetical protein ACOCRX_04510 [Candidatus Woesearchaeota archaeon]